MADWDDGYITDVPYVSGYHRESAPVWIQTAATLLGSAAPDIDRPFRYADLGCGNGVTALVVAATMPHAEVWAFDFNPAHVESCREIARRAGLTNIRFEEASFDDLANRPPDALPAFEYVVAHGVLSWVSLENRRRLFNVIGQRLAPGGIVYMSYNVTTGWTAMRPVRTLMRLLAETGSDRSDLALAGGFDLLEKMRAGGGALFQAHPTLELRLKDFQGYDRQYVAHELLNRAWYPEMFAVVAAAMTGIKCEFIGSATLAENIAALSVPRGMGEMFGRAGDVRLRETLRDLGSATGFRRDLYQRGTRRMSPAEHSQRAGKIGLARTFHPAAEPLTLEAPLGQFAVDSGNYHTVLEAVSEGHTTIDALRKRAALADWSDLALLEAVAVLIGSSYIAPTLAEPPSEAAKAASARLNQVHAAMFDEGRGRMFLAFPALGAAWQTDPLEIQALDELSNGQAADGDGLADRLMERFRRTGRTLQVNGTPVADHMAARELMTGKMREMLSQRLPAMRRLGLLDAISE